MRVRACVHGAALVIVPSPSPFPLPPMQRAPHDLYNNFTGRIREKMKLYVRRVFITDDFDDMMPKYLRFISGVVSRGHVTVTRMSHALTS